MLNRMKELFYRHVQSHFFLYFIVITCLLVGITAGAITINVLNTNQKKELISFLDTFFKILNENNIDGFVLLKQSIVNNIQTLVTIWILGVTVIGVPFIMGIVALRGFVIGFTVGFLFDELGLKGLLFSLLAILPQNIFIVPGLVIISVLAIGFSVKFVKSRIKRSIHFKFTKELTQYTTSILITAIILLIGSVVEAYITPVFMRLLSGYFA